MKRHNRLLYSGLICHLQIEPIPLILVHCHIYINCQQINNISITNYINTWYVILFSVMCYFLFFNKKNKNCFRLVNFKIRNRVSHFKCMIIYNPKTHFKLNIYNTLIRILFYRSITSMAQQPKWMDSSWQE